MATLKEIFEAGQILTLETAKILIGKRIAITNPEYVGNTASVREFVLNSVQSEWELADDDRRQYWSESLPESISYFKSTLRLVAEDGGDTPYAKCEPDNQYYNEPTFFGSDADRPIYFVCQ